MKKLLFLFLTVFVAFSFNSCSSDDEDNDVSDKVKVTIKCEECPSGTFYFYLNPSPTGTWYFLNNGGDSPSYDIRLTDGTELSYSETVFVKENGKDMSVSLKKNSNYLYLFVPQDRPAYYRHGTLKVFDIDTYLPYKHVW